MGRHNRPESEQAPPVPAVPPELAAPARPGWRQRRAARQERAENAALAARVARAERRNRQVSAFAIPSPRPADPVSGPLPLDTARPPWRSRPSPDTR